MSTTWEKPNLRRAAAKRRRMKETYNEYENTILRINASGIHKYVYKTQQVLVEETHDKIHTRTHTGRPICCCCRCRRRHSRRQCRTMEHFYAHSTHICVCVSLSKCFTECNGPYWIFFWFIVPNFKSLHCNMYAIFLNGKHREWASARWRLNERVAQNTKINRILHIIRSLMKGE